MKKKLIIATGNAGKAREFAALFPAYEVLSMKEAGFTGAIEETGDTFYENALIKARAVSEALGTDALADDSGMSVAALGGAPGVYSARYAGEGCTDSDNNRKLLAALEAVSDRRAKFVCALVLCRADGEVVSAEGETEGEVLRAPRGTAGFGYDPLFYSYDLKKSFGEATEEEKNAVSHRARAAEALKKIL